MTYTKRFKHGFHGTPTYDSWRAMKERCTNPSNKDYVLYKDRVICERWLEAKNFIEDMGKRPEGTTLDRRDNTKGYSKANCRWATQAVQHRNHSRNKFLNIGDVAYCLKDWASLQGIAYSMVRRRFKEGMTAESIVDYALNYYIKENK